jgi:tRNA(fMet)-specific endonuclease VapC
MRYMLDTNICIYLIKNNAPDVVKRLRAVRRGDAVMSVLTYAELRAGVEINSISRSAAARALDIRALQLLTTRVTVLPFMESAAESFGVMRATLKERNRDTMDRLIASHAASLGLILVTNNETDFKDYAELIVENWVTSH